MEQSVKKVFALRGEGYRTKRQQLQLSGFPPHQRQLKVSNAASPEVTIPTDGQIKLRLSFSETQSLIVDLNQAKHCYVSYKC